VPTFGLGGAIIETCSVDTPHAHSSPDQSGVAVDTELCGTDGLDTDMDVHALLHDM